MPEKSSLNLVWIDAEFTTTDLDKAHIMQIAMIVTTPDLGVVPFHGQSGLKFDVHLTQAQVETASWWVLDNQSEQLELCKRNGLPLEEVESKLVAYLLATCEVPTESAADLEEKDRVRKKNPVLAGNTIHNDYRMIQKYLPGLADRLSYRLVDVTTIKELLRRWRPDLEKFEKEKEGSEGKYSMVERYLPEHLELGEEEKHDALFDVKCSISELNYYRQKGFPQAVD
jgi:oligoribonuclease